MLTKNDVVKKLVENGKLACPESGEILQLDTNSNTLASITSGNIYQISEMDVPILLTSHMEYSGYVNASEKMNREYKPESTEKQDSPSGKLKKLMSKDYRSRKSIQAFDQIFSDTQHKTIIDIGGGPTRRHPDFINLNIGPFPNVDIVADAHYLPFVDSSIDAIHCEAVLEHLYNPTKAVAEMFRVLKPGGVVYSITPFMQPYHGYPYHYQNYTLTGHQLLYKNTGFEVNDSGVAVGATVALSVIIGRYYQTCFPKPLNKLMWMANGLIWQLFKPLDILLTRNPDSHVLASTTFVVAVKNS
jgi:SAM-dependent methyltransferase